jgi:hypothetical protein
MSGSSDELTLGVFNSNCGTGKKERSLYLFVREISYLPSSPVLLSSYYTIEHSTIIQHLISFLEACPYDSSVITAPPAQLRATAYAWLSELTTKLADVASAVTHG